MADMQCKICGEKDFKIIGTPRSNEYFPRITERNYRIVQCKNCSYYFVSPEIDLTQEEWQKLYEDNYFEASQKTKWQSELNDRELKDRMSIILNSIKTEKSRFLDMGCGEGYMLKEAEVNGFEPFGLDIAFNLNPDFAKNYKFFKGNISEANYPDDFFSVIYMDSVLEHVSNPYETVNELKRVLKPGGVLLIIVPNEDSLMNSFTKLAYYLTGNKSKYGKIKPFVTPYHIQGFNKKSLKTLFTRQGLEILQIKGFGGNYAFWKAFRPFTRQYMVSMATYPAGLLSVITGEQIQLMSIVRK
jgi:SAM-dependent methyltransferase